MTARTWCFTWNNYTPDSEMNLQCSKYVYLLYGREVASTGTKHLQGLLVLPSPQRLSYLRKTYGSSAHWEVCRNYKASQVYCKKDGDFFERDLRQKRGPKSGEPVRVVTTPPPLETVDLDRIIRKVIRKVSLK